MGLVAKLRTWLLSNETSIVFDAFDGNGADDTADFYSRITTLHRWGELLIVRRDKSIHAEKAPDGLFSVRRDIPPES